MRFNRAIIAVMAASAAMIATSVPVPVFAADTDAAAGHIIIGSVEIDDEGKVTYQVETDGVYKTYYDEATLDKTDAATCTTPLTKYYSFTLDGNTTTQTYTYGEKLGHDYESYEQVTEPATCKGQPLDGGDATGTKVVTYTCKRCGDTYTTTEYDTEKVHHVFDKSKAWTVNVAGTNTVVADDGTVSLDNVWKDGTYYVQTWNTCTSCGDDFMIDEELKTIEARALDEAVVTSTSNIQSGIAIGDKYNDVKKLADEDVVLINCGKDGSYVVTYTDTNGVESTKTITIAAHHSPTGELLIVGKTADDEKLLQAYYDKDGNLVVNSKSCYLDAEYSEYALCQSEACPNWIKDSGILVYPPQKGLTLDASVDSGYAEVSEKTAKAAGAHTIKTVTRESVQAAVDTYEASKLKATLSYADYTTFLSTLSDIKEIKVSKEYDCIKGGTVTITFLCTVCGAEVEDRVVTVEVPGYGHQPAAAVIENEVEPTCTENGSYDSVVYCSVCGEELSRKTTPILKIAHSFATPVAGFEGTVVVDYADGIWNLYENYKGFNEDGLGRATLGVVPTLKETCTVCGYTQDAEYDDIDGQIVSITRETEVGDGYDPGTIVLNVTYTVNGQKISSGDQSFDYFTSSATYLERNKTAEKKNGLVQEANGTYSYYVNDNFQSSYTGIVNYEGGKFFVANGVVVTSANGLNLNAADQKWYFLADGQVQTEYTGFAEYDGEWFVIEKGVLVDYNGLYDYDGGTFLVAAGQLVKSYNGLWENAGSKLVNPDGKWYFMAGGQVQNQYSGVAMYDGEFFVVEDGVLDTSYNGTIVYDGATFNVIAGQLY